MKKGIAFFALICALFIGCGKQESPSPYTTNDSLLSRPLDPVADPIVVPGQDSFKQYVDARRVRTPEHLAIMKRFDANPSLVAFVYRDFRSLRKKNVAPDSEEVKKFLAHHKITLEELKAILEEGDRLGWSKHE